MMMLQPIVRDVSPEIFRWRPPWYRLLVRFGFLMGFVIVRRMVRREGKPERDPNVLTIDLVGGTIIDARMGQVLFYHPTYNRLLPSKSCISGTAALRRRPSITDRSCIDRGRAAAT
jgi:prolipoprotein diacylglyceryltransferase